MGKRCLVTGASGHVGGNLVRLLLERGFKVRAFVHNDTRALSGLDIEKVNGNILDPSSLSPAFDGVSYAFHLAAQISVLRRDAEKVAKVNAVGTRNVVNASLEAGVEKLVHFSSVQTFEQKPLNEPLDESRGCASVNECLPYDNSKSDSENEVSSGIQRGLNAVIVNPTGIIGLHDYKPSYMGEVLEMLVQRRLPAVVDGGFDWVDVRDVCLGAVAALEKGRTGQSYILSGEWLNITELSAMLEELSGVRKPLFVSPMWLARTAAVFTPAWSGITGSRALFTSESLSILRTSNRNISHAKATSELDYQPRPIRNTLCDWYAWYKEMKTRS